MKNSHRTTTTTIVLRPFIRDYLGELVPEQTFTHPPCQSSSNLSASSIYYNLSHPLCSNYVLGNLFCTASVHVLFGLPSRHSFTQSVSFFRNTCPYHHNLFCYSINIISSIPSPSLNSLLGTLSFTLTSHIQMTILISAHWSATSFSFLTGHVSLPCSILLHKQLLYSLPLLISDISLLVSNGTNCQFGFWPPQLQQHLQCYINTVFI